MKRKLSYIIAAASVLVSYSAFAAPSDTDSVAEIAFGQKIKSSAFVGAKSTVASHIIDDSRSVGLDKSVMGHLSGTTMIQSSSLPGSDNCAWYIRGLASVNGNAVLYVLDGVPAPTLSPNTLDPTTIESVTVLKDAAAKAIYGPLGAQGVVLINTRQGHAGKTRVNVSLSYGINDKTRDFEPVNALGYATLRNQALANDGKDPLFSAEQLDAFRNGQGINNNWKQMFLKNTTSTQLYNVSADGGTDRIKFYINAGFAHQDGIYNSVENEKYNPNPYYNRFTALTNVKVKVFKHLDAALNTNLRIYRSNGSTVGTGTILHRVLTTPATVPGPFTEDGLILTDENFTNPAYGSINKSGYNKSTGTDVNANFRLDLDMSFLTRGLSAHAIVGYHSYYTGAIIGSTDYTRYILDMDGNPVQFGSNADSPLSLGKSSNTVYFMNLQGSVNYDRTFFDRLSVNAVANYLAEDRISTGFDSKSALPYRRIQFGGQLHLGWDNRYLLQGTITDAGSEEFCKGNQYHVSTSIGGAWDIAREHFIDADWLKTLKLRASYGALCYDNIYAIGRLLYSSEIRQQSGAGLIQSLYTAALIQEYQLGNAAISWEKSYQQNYGIDIALGCGFNAGFDYWKTIQKGVIGRDNSKPGMTGISSDNLPYENIGRVVSHGYDLSLEYRKALNCGLKIGVTGILSYNTNRVEEIGEYDLGISGYAYPYRTTGYPIGQQFGYIVDYSNGNGFYNTQEQLDANPLSYEGVRAPRLGDLIYKDLNGDGVINVKDQAPLEGTRSLPSYSFSLNLDAAFKGFDLSMFWQGSAGKSSYYSGVGIHEDFEQGVFSPIHENAWTAERYAAGEEISYPALSTGGALSLEQNDFLVSKNDYVRLKNLVVGYTLPQAITMKAGISSLRVFFSGENLLTITNFRFKKFIDPEQASVTSYPIYKTFNFGLNVNF